jgi:hypothetical protein
MFGMPFESSWHSFDLALRYAKLYSVTNYSLPKLNIRFSKWKFLLILVFEVGIECRGKVQAPPHWFTGPLSLRFRHRL